MKRLLSIILVMIMLLSSSVNMTANAGEEESIGGEEIATAGEVEVIGGEEVVAAEKIEEDIIDTETAEAPSTVTEKGMQFRIENLEDVKSIRYAYGEYETEKDIKYGVDSVSHSAKTLRTRGNSCVLQFPKPGLVSIVITYNDGTRDFHKYEVIKSSPTVTRDGGNSITFSDLSDLKVLRYVKGEYESSYDIKRAEGSVAVSGKTLNSDTYTVELERETYTFCVQYNDESYNYYVTGICGDDLTWVYDMQTCTLTISGEGEMYEYSSKKDIPWYDYKLTISNILLNEGITSLCSGSFRECSLLGTIDLPSTLKTIGATAFSACDSLKFIIIPNSVKSIGNFAFSRCKSLETLVIPDDVTEIGEGTFQHCDNLKSLTIGNGVKTINMFAFGRCTSLTSVVFPKNLERICSQAFTGCSSLENIQLPDKAINIESDCFIGTPFFTNPDNWENDGLYLDNYLITGNRCKQGLFTVKNGTKYIGSYSLVEIPELQEVIIPQSVVFICNDAIPKDVIICCYENSYAHEYAMENGYVYEFIFEGTVGGICGDDLTWVYDLQSATLTISGEGEMYDYEFVRSPWFNFRSGISNLILNEGITTIGIGSFSNLNITEVNFPSTLKTIGQAAFSGCISLETLVIPDNITEIGYGTFESCYNLKSLTIGNGVKTIYMLAFGRCTSLTSVVFPKNLERVCTQAFSGCSSLENIQLPDKAINIESDCFIGTPFFTNSDNWENDTLYLDNYLIVGLSHNQGLFTVKNGTKYIGSNSLIEISELQKVMVPQSVVFIGDNAISKDVKICCYKNSYAHEYAMDNGYVYELIFEGTVGGICGDDLTWVYDMQTRTLTISGEGEMYDYFFKTTPWNEYKSEISNLVLNEGITTISTGSFGGLNITEVNFPSTLKTIGQAAFSGCIFLEALVIPDNVTEIFHCAFENCYNLKSLTIGNGVKTIYMLAFGRCTSLTSVVFPKNLERVCTQAFSGCSSLENIQLPDKAINIESDCFIGTPFFTNPDNWENDALYLDNYLITGNRYNQGLFTVKNGTKYIGSYSLVEIPELQEVIIPQSVVFIGDNAIPKDVKICCYENSYAHEYAMENGYVYEFIFEGAVGGICGDNLTWVYDFQTATLTVSGTGEMYEYDYPKRPWVKYISEIKKLVLNEGITSISNGAFAEFSLLDDVEISSSVTIISSGAFSHCVSLESIVIPGNVVKIGDAAFNECCSLNSIAFANGVKTIGFCAFSSCTSLVAITLPETLEEISSQAFSYCESLETVQLPGIPIKIKSDSFIHTPLFSNRENWHVNGFYIGNYLLYVRKETNLSSYTVKEGTKYISPYALAESGIRTVTIPDSVEVIYEYAIPDKEVVIYCYKNSYAHKYAMENGYRYQLIG